MIKIRIAAVMANPKRYGRYFFQLSSVFFSLLGVDKGKIRKGYDADFILTDDEYNLIYTVIGGEIFCKK